MSTSSCLIQLKDMKISLSSMFVGNASLVLLANKVYERSDVCAPKEILNKMT
ncbi:hypothetical protein FHS56_002147 [Thermonema lapsum]|uniref:Uncharacterized protein n=1 Tax=Thermonema lapsum TaxID=28195 RepID=A0A846MSF6_9BACT|nr:hypothetical protein [Thermonema lapsum]NIK74618.1 hypothetical protein [Thermonema lapsum]